MGLIYYLVQQYSLMSTSSSSKRPIGQLYVNLQKRLQSLANNSKYPEDDLRHLVFLQFLGVIQPVIIIINIIYTVLEDKIPTNFYPMIFGIEKQWKKEQFETFERFNQSACVILFHFIIENFLKNILMKLLQQEPPRKYSQLVEKTMAKIYLNEKDKKSEFLKALGNFRNVYHNNGIHGNKESQLIIISGEKFEFVQGKPVKHFNWIHMHFLFNEIISIIEEIISTKEVETIKEKISAYIISD